jgi:hypothetical protein
VNGPWCLEPESNRHARFHEAADFKSAVSTNFTIEADGIVGQKAEKPREGAGAWSLEARTGVEPI